MVSSSRKGTNTPNHLNFYRISQSGHGEEAERTETPVEEVDTDSECNLDRAYPALKSNGEHVRVVTDLHNINTNIKRPNHPTESGTQVLRHLKASSKYF